MSLAYLSAGRLCRVVAVILLLISSVPTAPSAAAPGLSPALDGPVRRKILVDNDDLVALRALGQSDARRLADYDSFSLWSIPAAETRALQGQAAPGDYDAIYLRGGQTVDTHAAAPVSLGVPSKGSQFWMVQFVGPTKDTWLQALVDIGLRTVIYMPNNAYVVWGDAASVSALNDSVAKSPFIQWTGPYQTAYRLAPSLQTAQAEQLVDVTVQLYRSADLQASLDRLLALTNRIYKQPAKVLDFTNVSLQLPASALAPVSAWPDVFNVEPYVAPQKLDEVQGQILAGQLTTVGGNVIPTGPGYLSWLASLGFPTTSSSYPVVDVVDDGIDTGDVNNVLHPDFHYLGALNQPSRVAYIGNCTGDTAGDGLAGHGNINAGIVASYNDLTGWPYVDAGGYRIGLGMSPFGRVASTKIFANSGYYDVSKCGNDAGVVQASYNAGADLTSNSWGAATYGAYDSSAQAYDALTRDASASTTGNQEMLHVFAAGNKGPSSSTTTSPGTAKNVLTVGATENVRDDGVADGCNVTRGASADNIIGFSSRGPAADGRMKPDLMAPGTHIQGPASQDPGFDGTGVCGPASGLYYPPSVPNVMTNTLYTWSSGTSHSTPAVAGAASLTYEYYHQALNPGHTPSPAMVKALLINSSRYLTGTSANDTLPSPSQGWGDANLGSLFDGAPRQVLDQDVTFASTGQVYQFGGAVADSGKPFRVTLAWTDAPGSTTGASYVNNLDLEVTIGGVVYRGNVFAGSASTSGGSFDTRNNVENVFLSAGISGPFTVRVVSRNLAGDGVPGNGDATDQDFALVIYNIQPSAVLAPGTVTATKIAGSAGSFLSPGDTFDLDIDLSNVGKLDATHVSGVVTAPLGDATVLTGTSPYPPIPVGQTRTNQVPYEVQISPDTLCGSPLALEQAVQYDPGATMLHTFDIPTGLAVPYTRTDAYTGTLPVPIPDNNLVGVSVTIGISGTGTVQDVKVHFDAVHTWDGDLTITLVSPSGTPVLLSNRRGGSGDNYAGTVFDDAASTSIANGTPPYSGHYRPETPLSALEGEPVGGNWVLKVVDSAAIDTGSITGYSLDLQAVKYLCAQDLKHRLYFPILMKSAR